MKLRWKILILLGILFVLLAVSLTVTLHVQPGNELDAYKQSLRARGEKLELSEVIPHTAPESNSVEAVNNAFSLLNSAVDLTPYAMQMVAPGRALIGARQPDARAFDFTNSWEDFAAVVDANWPALELLRQVLERPALDFQLDYQRGSSMLLPHLAPLKRATQQLEAAAVLDLHQGDSGDAATNILIMLALVHNNASEGLLISHLVRNAITSIAVTPTWELLQATNVTDAQLAQVQTAWQQMDFLSDAENAVQMERAWFTREIQATRNSHEKFSGMASWSGSGSSGSWDWGNLTESSRTAVGEVMWRSSWSYSQELKVMKADQVILETLRVMRTNRTEFYKADYDAMIARLATLGLTNASPAFFRALKIPDFHEGIGLSGLVSTFRKTLLTETERRIIVTAIALKRFELKYGKPADRLAELSPEFLPAVPIDPFDGKPLKYHPNPDGTFLLYSVGEDGVDDGGDPSPTKTTSSSSPNLDWTQARDCVWPQPASPAEAQSFYAHPPK